MQTWVELSSDRIEEASLICGIAEIHSA